MFMPARVHTHGHITDSSAGTSEENSRFFYLLGAQIGLCIVFTKLTKPVGYAPSKVVVEVTERQTLS